MRGIGVHVGIHFHWRFFIEVHVPIIQPLVGVADFLGVRRPRRRIIKSRGIAEIDFANRPEAALLADVQRVFSGLIGKIRNRFSIRRPRGIALHHGRGVGQIADVALLGRHGQNLPPHAEHRASACRRNVRGADSPRLDFQEVRADFCEIGYRLDIQCAVVSGVQVQQMQRSELLVDNGVSRCGGRLDIESIVFNNLSHLLRLEIVGEKSHRAIAV